MLSSVSFAGKHTDALLAVGLAPLALLLALLLAPVLVPPAAVSRSRRLGRLLGNVRGALVRVRAGLRVFRNPRQAAAATVLQLSAWGLQWLSCWLLLMALGLDRKVGFGAAAAVLFAVNVTAVIPATPANVGVFQAACVAVLAGAYHVPTADALAYGIVLAGGRGRHRRHHGHARARQRGALLEGRAPAHDARLAREALATAGHERGSTRALACAVLRTLRRTIGVERRIEINGRRLGVYVALSRWVALHRLDQRSCSGA